MNRRSFFKMGAACLGTAAAARPASAFVPAHNWDGYNWGAAPPVIAVPVAAAAAGLCERVPADVEVPPVDRVSGADRVPGAPLDAAVRSVVGAPSNAGGEVSMAERAPHAASNRLQTTIRCSRRISRNLTPKPITTRIRFRQAGAAVASSRQSDQRRSP